jgi:hypothetical protein
MALLGFLLAIAGVIYALTRLRRSNLIFFLAFGIWAALPFYDHWILSRCPGDCGIRIDLIPVGVVVILASGFAMFEIIRRWRAR